MATMRFSSTIARQMIYDVKASANDYSTSPVGWTGREYPFGNSQFAIFGYSGISSQGTGYVLSKLNIYKGTPETFPSFTDLSNRSSDLLISFNIPNLTAGSQYIGVVDQKIRWLVSKQLAITQATGTGTATWFLAFNNVVAGTSLTARGAMIGSVGVSGSGADLEIPNIEISSGTNYQTAGFYINLPQNWTV